jgi:Leucine-rich repeat (LRR) protein
VSPDGGTALATPLTPQNRAVNWLANNTNLDSYSDKRKIQRYTLGVLYYSTNGDSWRNNNGWLTDANECNWSNGADGLFCDENGAIFELDLYDGSGNNLVGTIPIELTLLSDSVASLALGDNSLMGTIPSEVGLLSKLTLLSIWGNTLTDMIPSQIALLSNLSWLDLGDNSLSGTIPSQLGLLSKLTVLGLYNNSLTGTIPSQLGLLTKLTELSLWDNSLTGTIPSELGLMSNLSYLDLSVNSLTGTIPSEVGLLTKLTGLFVYNNNFTGEFTCPAFIEDCWISCDWATDTYTQACRSL